MKWEKASAIAEIVSSVAVLLTLVYLAIQTKELATQTEVNTAAIIASSRMGALNADMQLMRMIADYPEARFSVHPAEPDKLRRYLSGVMFFRIRESDWLLHRDGQLDASTWKAYSDPFVGLLAIDPNLRDTWRKSAVLLDPEFVRDIELRIPAERQQEPANKEGTQAAP